VADLDPAVVRAEAERRVRAALANVEAAQRELGRACEEMSAIIGGIPPWERLGKLYDRVHAEWHRLNLWFNGARSKLDLDEAGRRALAKRLAAQKAGAPDA
jgi:hypothetical protein